MTSTSPRRSEIKMKNVSDEVVSPYVFASLSSSTAATSSSLPSEGRHYDVFINYRRPDVEHTLARVMCNTLNFKGLRVFLGSEDYEVGNYFSLPVEEAISSARLHIAIFSPTYAQSPWCLAELSLLLKSGKPIMPVFYRVQPSDLRLTVRGKGLYVNAFLDHQEKGYYSKDKLEEWKMALYTASFLKGEIINNDDEKQWVLKNTVNHVLKVRNMLPLEVAKHPVGLEEACTNFEMIIRESEKNHHNVQIVGIWGMGGSGKTTLAKELYNKRYSTVEKSTFLCAAKSQSHKNQIKLLQDLGFNDRPIDNIEQGKAILLKRLRSVSVLIVLDDVEHMDQLDALLPMKDNLARGSMIIVTTREKEILKCWGVSSIYKIKELNHAHAKQLFCWHAFLQPSPPLGFEELVEKFAIACNGLPLSLRVFGDHFYGCFSKYLWEDALHQISQILPDDIRSRLKVSYDALDEEEKQMFLDVACFFIGEDKLIATAVWEGSGWNGLHGWERLTNKCLVDLDNSNRITMHDHLRDLGREIAKTQSPCRLWSPEQSMHIQKQKEGIIQIRGMIINADVQNFPTFLLRTCKSLCGHRRTRGLFPVGLKILVVRGKYQNNIHITKLSRDLAWFSWTECAHRNLPSWLSLKNLRVLELHSSQKLVSLWKDGAEAPVQLRVLSISDCPELRRIPSSIGYLYNLKKIVIEGSNHLRKLDILPAALEDIRVKDCKSLRNINVIGDLVNLRELMLSRCPALDVLPSFHRLASLEAFELTGVNKVEKIQGLQWCTSLEKLMLNCKCCEVAGIESLEQLQRLRRLVLVAKKGAAVEPCIQTIQKWPEEIIICTKAVANAGSHLNSSTFRNLSVHSFANKKISYVVSRLVTLPEKCSSNANARMLCLFISCLSRCIEIVIKVDPFDAVFSTEVEEGNWILIGVFTQQSRCLTAQNFYIHRGRADSCLEQTELIPEGVEVEKGFVVTGEELFIMEAFHRLLALLGS